jgi:hypothetical protein
LLSSAWQNSNQISIRRGNMPKGFEFNLLVTDINREQADSILHLIEFTVDLAGGKAAGGFAEVDAEEGEDEGPEPTPEG